MNIQFLEAAREEIGDAFRWYEERERGLGQDFLDEVRTVLSTIEADPLHLPIAEDSPQERDVRYLALLRFPFRGLFEIRTRDIVVLAVAHHRRRPGYWRLRD